MEIERTAVDSAKTEMEKRKLEIDLNVSVWGTDDGDKLKAAEAEAASLKSLLEKRAMEAEKQLKLQEDEILELTQSIKVLEGEKRKLGDELSQANRSQREEIDRISSESEKIVSEMADRIQVLNLEKREMAEEIKRMLNVTAEHAKINSEHALIVEVLERDKLRLEMETRNKDQVIKGLVQKQNQCSSANKEKPEIPLRMHPVSNAGISGEKLKADARSPYGRLFVNKRRRKEAKDPNRPKRPLSPFFVFMEEFRKIFKEKHPNNKSVGAVSSAACEEWRKMSEADKAPYVEKSIKWKKEYEKSMVAYNKPVCGEHDSEEESDKSSYEVHDVDDDVDEEDSDEGNLLVIEHNGLESQVGTKLRKSGQVWTTPETLIVLPKEENGHTPTEEENDERKYIIAQSNLERAELNEAMVRGIRRKDGKRPYPNEISLGCEGMNVKKKLLILNVNGLLADIVSDPKRDTPLGKGLQRKQGFHHQEPGTPEIRMNLESIVDYILGEKKNKLLFCWHKDHCTDSGHVIPWENDKPLVFKELKKLWDKEDPTLPWEKGDYDESNTLLIDDTPYKALLNPSYTAISPGPYTYLDIEDNRLAQGGFLHEYLQSVAKADHVQKFVEANRYGMRPINHNSVLWSFYAEVLEGTVIGEPKW